MDLLKALDVLSTVSIEKAASDDDIESRKVKIAACKVVVEQLSAPSLRNSPDFPRFLSVGSASLIRMHGDDDINVRAAAEECLNKIIFEYIDSHPERILFELYKVVKKGRGSGRAQKSALLKFSEICHFIKPSKCRKYITSLLVPLADIINDGSDILQEALAQAMDKICASLLCYLKDKEIQHLIELLLKNMHNSNATIRRSSALSIVAICKYSPSLPISSFQFTIDSLLSPLQTSSSSSSSLIITSENANYILGVLNSLFQLVKLSYKHFDSKQTTSQRHPVISYIRSFIQIIIPSLKYSEHNLVGAALELLNEILNSYGKVNYVWGTVDDFHSQMKSLINILVPFCQEKTVRTSNKAVAITCLAQISNISPIDFILYFSQYVVSMADYFSSLQTNSDPLIRGNAYLCLGYLISGILDKNNNNKNVFTSKVEEIDVNEMINTIVSATDESNIAIRFICKSLGKCLKTITNKNSFLSEYNLRWSLQIIARLLSITKNDTYWLVVVETLQALAKADYRILHLLEDTLRSEESPQMEITNTLKSVDLQIDRVEIMQNRVIEFMIAQLSDNDQRIRNNSAAALVVLLPKLYFNSFFNKIGTGYANSLHLAKDWKWLQDNSKTIERNLTHIVNRMIKELLEKNHSNNLTKGIFYCFLLLARNFSHIPSNSTNTLFLSDRLKNPIGSLIGEMLPLVLEYLSCSQWMSLDIDTHISCLQIIGFLCKGSERLFMKYHLSTLRHLLQVINVLTLISQNKPFPIKDKVESGPGVPLGLVTNDSLMNKLYDRLVATRNAHISAFTSEDKFSQLRSICFETLAIVMQSIGKEIVPYAEEITGYLLSHFPHESKRVMTCVKELFICVFDSSSETTPVTGETQSPPLVQTSSIANTQLSLLESRRLSILSNHGIYDEVFVSNETLFSQRQVEAIDLKEYIKSASNNKNKQMLRLFEPLVVKALTFYQLTGNVSTQCEILSLMTELVRFGVDFSRLDKDSQFVNFIINQTLAKNNYMDSPAILLPSIYLFLAVLFIVKPHIIDALNTDQVMELLHVAFSPCNYNMTGYSMISLRTFMPYLFAVSKEEEKKWDTSHNSSLRKIQQEMFNKIAERIQFVQGSSLAAIVLNQTRSSKDALVELDWKQYSQEMGAKLVKLLDGKEKIYINTTKEVMEYYGLMNEICVSSLPSLSIIESLVSLQSSQISPQLDSRLAGEFFESKGLHKSWIPAFVLLLRSMCIMREETLISAAEQSLAKLQNSSQNPIFFVLSIIFSVLEKLFDPKESGSSSEQIENELKTHALHNFIYLLIGDKRSRFAEYLVSNLSSSFASSIRNITSSIIVKDPIIEHGLAWIHLLAYLKLDQMILICLEDSRNLTSWNGKLIYASCFLSTCQLLVNTSTSKSVANSLISSLIKNTSFIFDLINHIEESTVRLAVQILSESEEFRISFLSLFSTVNNNSTYSFVKSSFIRKFHCLQIIEQFPPSVEVIKITIDHFCSDKQHWKLLQPICNSVLSKSLSYFVSKGKSGGEEEEEEEGEGNNKDLKEIKNIYLIHKNTNLYILNNPIIKSLFNSIVELIGEDKSAKEEVHENTNKDFENTNKDSENTNKDSENTNKDSENSQQVLTSKSLLLQLTSNLNEHYSVSSTKAFAHVDLLANIDPNSFKHLLESNELNLAVLPQFIQVKTCDPFKENISKFLLSQIKKHTNTENIIKDWDSKLLISESLSLLIDKYSIKILNTEESSIHAILLFANLLFSSFIHLLKFRNWIPFDSAILFQLATSLVDSYEVEFIQQPDNIWSLLLLNITKLYTLMAHGGYIRYDVSSEIDLDSLPRIKVVTYLLNNILKESPVDFALSKFATKVGRKHFSELYPIYILQTQTPSSTIQLSHSTSNPENINALLNDSQDLTNISTSISDSPSSESSENVHDTSEDLLKITLKLMARIGWQNSSQFKQLWDVFHSFLPTDSISDSQPSPMDVNTSVNEEYAHLFEEISEETQVIAIAGISAMLLKALLEKSQELNNNCLGKANLNYCPREKELSFLGTDNGRRLCFLQSCVDASIHESQDITTVGTIVLSSNATILSDILNSKDSQFITKSSPFHANIERFPSYVGKQEFNVGQFSVLDLRENANKEKIWNEMDLSAMIQSFVSLLHKILDTTNNNTISMATRSKHLVQKQALKSLILLSDLFSISQFDSTLDLLHKLADNDNFNDNFLIQQYTVLGICKFTSVLQIAKGPTPLFIPRLLKQSFEQPELVLHLSALNGILYLMDGQMNKVLSPFLQILFKYIATTISNDNIIPSKIKTHCLAVSFLLMEQFTKESEENDFTNQSILSITNQTLSKDHSLPVLNAIYRGLQRALVSFSVSQSQRTTISSFSSKKNRALLKFPSNSVQSLMALSLMVTCMYSGDADKREEPDSDEKPLSYMENMERVQLLFSKIHKKGFPHEVDVLLRILPPLLMDLFNVEQALSLTMGELVKQLAGGYPELIALVLCKLFEIAREQGMQTTINTWICICLSNFLQVKSETHKIWALTCLFLSASNNLVMQLMFKEIVLSIHDDEGVFVVAALEFFKWLDEDAKKNFATALSSQKHPVYSHVLNCCFNANK